MWSEMLTKVEVCDIEIKGLLSHKRIDNTASALLFAGFIDTTDPLPELPACQ